MVHTEGTERDYKEAFIGYLRPDRYNSDISETINAGNLKF
jgi:hypothetical protein